VRSGAGPRRRCPALRNGTPLAVSTLVLPAAYLARPATAQARAQNPVPTSADRDVRYRNGTVEKQRKTTLGVMSYADTLQFIEYNPTPNTNDSIAGTVDMKGYLQWLNNHGYNIDMTTL
jgi:hypothetical protein